jgi:hypothetical protein
MTDDTAGPMHVDVNGTRLWFDVDGPALVPDGAEMRDVGARHAAAAFVIVPPRPSPPVRRGDSR